MVGFPCISREYCSAEILIRRPARYNAGKKKTSSLNVRPHCLDFSFVRMIGIKVISSPKAQSVLPTFGIRSPIPFEVTLLIFLATGH